MDRYHAVSSPRFSYSGSPCRGLPLVQGCGLELSQIFKEVIIKRTHNQGIKHTGTSIGGYENTFWRWFEGENVGARLCVLWAIRKTSSRCHLRCGGTGVKRCSRWWHAETECYYWRNFWYASWKCRMLLLWITKHRSLKCPGFASYSGTVPKVRCEQAW